MSDWSSAMKGSRWAFWRQRSLIEKLYPLIGLTLSLAIVMTMVALAIFTLAVAPSPG